MRDGDEEEFKGALRGEDKFSKRPLSSYGPIPDKHGASGLVAFEIRTDQHCTPKGAASALCADRNGLLLGDNFKLT